MVKILKDEIKKYLLEENHTEKNRKFFDTWSKSYDWKPFQFWMKKFQKPVIEELKLRSPEVRILDVSCGTGELLLSLRKQGKKNLFGIDLSEKMLEKAREKFLTEGQRKIPQEVYLQLADVVKLPFPDHCFDYVLSTEAFHHYPNQQKALEEMKRIVKNGGIVVITDINFFIPFLHGIFQKIEPGCVKVNSKKEMRELFQGTGLQEIRQRRSFLFAVMTEGRKLTKTI